MTTQSDADTHAGQAVSGDSGKWSLLGRIKEVFKSGPTGELLIPTSSPVTLSSTVRVAWGGQPFALRLGKVALQVHPDLPISGDENAGPREWIVHAGSEFYDGVPKFVRIPLGSSVLFGRSDSVQKRIFQYDKSVGNRHVRISNRKGELAIEPLDLERSTDISELDGDNTVWVHRRENFMRLPDVLGRPLTEFGDDEAVDIISKVNGILAEEVYRDLDEEGTPGGIIRIPDDKTVVLMGDVHARAENLLRVITEGGLLRALEKDKACLVLLGDMIHSQEADELEEMDSSIFMIDLFSALKLRFPENVFYLHGNHESFSPDVGKGGVPQGILFRKHLKKRRGKAYVAEVESLFAKLAFVVQGNGFAACHGGPVLSRINRNTLVNIQRYPGIQHELVWNRLRRGNRPAGYSKGSVKRFRQTLDLPKHAPVIVGHTPLSTEETLWLNVGDIQGHHIVYSAHTHRLAAIVMSEGQFTPLEFIPEPAPGLLVDTADAGAR